MLTDLVQRMLAALRRPGRSAATGLMISLIAVTILCAAAAQQNGMIVSTFDGDRIETRSGLALWIFTDEQFGGTSSGSAVIIRPGAGGSRGALRVEFRVTEDARNPFASVWAMVAARAAPTDLSSYRGVRFHARGADRRAFTAGIVRYSGLPKRYMASFEVFPGWNVVELPFDTFRELTIAGTPVEGAPPLGPDAITSVGFSVARELRGAYALDIDNLEFYR